MSYSFHAKPLTKSHEAVRTLRRVQVRGFRSAVIAGGAIGDLFFGKRPRDYDIFVMTPYLSKEFNTNNEPTSVPEFWFDVVGCNRGPESNDYVHQFNRKEDYDEDSPYFASNRVSEVYKIQKNSVEYNIVLVDTDPREYVENYFDFGICRALCDGFKNIYTSDFMKDATNKTITICEAAFTKETFDYSVKRHLPRVRAKFPYFDVKVHPSNELFIDDENRGFIGLD